MSKIQFESNSKNDFGESYQQPPNLSPSKPIKQKQAMRFERLSEIQLFDLFIIRVRVRQLLQRDYELTGLPAIQVEVDRARDRVKEVLEAMNVKESIE